jgi:hypothetical protein
MELVAIPSADRMFAGDSPDSGATPLTQVTNAVTEWFDRRLAA